MFTVRLNHIQRKCGKELPVLFARGILSRKKKGTFIQKLRKIWVE